MKCLPFAKDMEFILVVHNLFIIGAGRIIGAWGKWSSRVGEECYFFLGDNDVFGWVFLNEST